MLHNIVTRPPVSTTVVQRFEMFLQYTHLDWISWEDDLVARGTNLQYYVLGEKISFRDRSFENKICMEPTDGLQLTQLACCWLVYYILTQTAAQHSQYSTY
jgi:hypothetical protein